MKTDIPPPKGKWPVLRTILISVLLIVTLAGVYFYNNFNRLLSEALLKSFNSSIASEVYELKFENLRVNLIDRSIRVFNVTLLPREKPLHKYPYINSSFRLSTDEILLDSVHLRTLLQENKLNVKKISIIRPTIEAILRGKRHIMLPFKDSTAVDQDSTSATENKNALKSFNLKEFRLEEAAFHIVNTSKQREFRIDNFSVSLQDLLISQQPGEYSTSFNRVLLTLGRLTGNLQQDVFRSLEFKAFNVGVDSLEMKLTLDTLLYRFRDFSMGLNELDVQTADSLFHLTMQSFAVSYKVKSIKLNEVSFKPNVSHAVLQRKYRHQHTEFSGTIGSLAVNRINFDSLLYAKKLFIDEVIIDQVKASIYKDKAKPMDSSRFPAYLGQTISKIRLPLMIKHIKATHLHLENTERKTDSTLAKVNITRATVDVKNITNLSPNSNLEMKADAYINDKAHFKAGLTFYYSKPQFDFEGTVDQFKLPDLNPLIQAYTPAKINKGIADEITFSGVATEKKATGTMKFLYHGLEIDLELQEKAKWKSAIIAFASNTATDSSNPPTADLPPKVVQFGITRDMNKGFINVVIKSLLNGLKETMIMNKDNRKAYKVAKKAAKQPN
jgi:hypothetical protein